MRGPLLVLAACYTGSTPAPEPPPPEPAKPPAFEIAGRWNYVVRTNECNDGTGHGMVDFAPRGNTFIEHGHVVWPDGVRIDWSGEMTPSRETVQANSLDDAVASKWYIDRERDRLIVRWRQTNGCSGIGIATRPGAPEPRFETLRVCEQCQLDANGCVRDAKACPALCCR